ncbi:TPA: membrane protein YoeI, partial [Escherichia coli]|nr:membrane protein YoeI [Escherichia coli]
YATVITVKENDHVA